MVRRVSGSSPLVLTLSLAAVMLSACKPKIEGRPSLVDSERVLAVVSQPAEAKAKADIHYTALYVNQDGTLDAAELDYALCTQRKALAATGPIAAVCLARSGKSLISLTPDEKQEIVGQVPEDACRVFGPNAPAPKPGEPPSRAADPDTTGGYYQPIRVLFDSEGKPNYAAGVTRLDCGLAGASQEQSVAYTKQHRPNENPALESLMVRRGGRDDMELSGVDAESALRVKPGATIELRARWMTCPKTPECGDGICSPGEECKEDCPATDAVGCKGAEPYIALDPATHELDKRHEAIRISWFASDGRFDHERTGRSEAEASTSYSDNSWTAPDSSGAVQLWVVIRDDRGGVGYGAYKLDVAR